MTRRLPGNYDHDYYFKLGYSVGHPVQTNGQSARHRHLGYLPALKALDFSDDQYGPRRQLKRFQFLASVCSPQPLLTAQAFVQGYGLPLIHHPGAHLHQAVSLPQPLPQVTVVPARYLDLRKTIFPQHVQDMVGVLASGLLLACSPALSLGGLADPQLEVQFAHQPFETNGRARSLPSPRTCLACLARSR